MATSQVPQLPLAEVATTQYMHSEHGEVHTEKGLTLHHAEAASVVGKSNWSLRSGGELSNGGNAELISQQCKLGAF